jgi:hypothetical protein
MHKMILLSLMLAVSGAFAREQTAPEDQTAPQEQTAPEEPAPAAKPAHHKPAKKKVVTSTVKPPEQAVQSSTDADANRYTGVLLVCGVVLFIIVIRAVVRGYRSDPNAPATHVCVDCGHTWRGVKAHREGWTFLFFPFNIFAPKKLLCQVCKGRLIPVASPRGKQLSN